MGDLKELQQKQKLSTEEINDFTLKHSEWAASVIKNASGSEMYREFCSCFENFAKCYEKLGMIKNESDLGCIFNEFLNQNYSENNKPQLRPYLKEVILNPYH